jgi:hypothetical protein
MNWLQRVVDSVCKRFGVVCESNNTIHIGNYRVKIIDQKDLYDIKVIDMKSFTSPINTANIFYDDLEQNLEETLKKISENY